MKNIYSECPSCGGTGEENISSLLEGETISSLVTCRRCAGSGKVSNLFLSADLIDLFNDLKDKVTDIKEKVDEL